MTTAVAATPASTTTPAPNSTVQAAPAVILAPDATAVAAEPARVEEERISRHFAAIAKREKALLDREKSSKDRDLKYSEWEKMEQRFKEDPMAALDHYGHRLDDVVKRAANGGKLTTEQLAQKAIDEIEGFKKQTQTDKDAAKRAEDEKAAQAAKEQETTAITNFKGQLKEHLDGNPEKYELTLKQDEPVELIYNVIDLVYEQSKKAGNPRILSFEEACAHVEKGLEEEADKFLSVGKIRSKITQAEAQKTPAASAPNPTGGKPKETVTLSNELASRDTPVDKSGDNRKISSAERRAKSLADAAKSLRWQST